MKKKTKNPTAAKRYANLSLQFWRDKEGTPNFTVTYNPLKGDKYLFTPVDGMIFAENLVKSNLIQQKDLHVLRSFFNEVTKILGTEK